MKCIISMTRSIRKILRSRFGIEVAYAKYCPLLSENKIFSYYLGHEAKVDMVFDVGANIGQSALELSKSFLEATIHSFEPFQENFKKLQQNTRDVPSIHPHRLALTDRNGSIEVLVDTVENSEWNSITSERQKTLAQSSSSRQEKVDLMTGDSFCDSHLINQIDILKVDTEGHDLEVIKGFDQRFKKGSIRSVLVEVGFLQDLTHGNFQLINEYLTSQGMLLAGFYETCYFESGKCEFTNALYINTRTIHERIEK